MDYRQQPQDAVPAEYAQQPAFPQPQYAPPQQGYAQPPYGAPQPVYYAAPPQPVVVNVTQNAGGGIAMVKPVRHLMHWTLTFLTGGFWLFVYIPILMKRRKIVIYR